MSVPQNHRNFKSATPEDRAVLNRQTQRSPMRRTSLPVIHVRRRPSRHSQGWLAAGNRVFRVALGRSGTKASKREGDGATPVGRFRPVRLWLRADRLTRPRVFLPIRRIGPNDAWCEDPHHRRYNRAFQRSANQATACGAPTIFTISSSRSTIMSDHAWPVGAAPFSSMWRGRVSRPRRGVSR
jgi:L,D-peptidoglycan transpeptidase YkuD (ErfK/YbiS/YcfS/YnhG family)